MRVVIILSSVVQASSVDAGDGREGGSVVIIATLKQNVPGVQISSRCRREKPRKPSI